MAKDSIPIQPEDEESLDMRVERLVRRGQIAPASAAPAEPLPPSRKARGALQRFLEDRDEVDMRGDRLVSRRQIVPASIARLR